MNNTDALTVKLLELINQVQNAVSFNGTESINLILTSIRINGICSLLCWFSILLLITIWLITNIRSDIPDTRGYKTIIFISFVIFLFLVYPWNWIKIVNPKLYLAHEIINNVLDKPAIYIRVNTD